MLSRGSQEVARVKGAAERCITPEWPGRRGLGAQPDICRTSNLLSHPSITHHRDVVTGCHHD